MSSTFVCSSCSRQLLRAAKRKTPRPWSRATFISFLGEATKPKLPEQPQRRAEPRHSQKQTSNATERERNETIPLRRDRGTPESLPTFTDELLDYVPGRGRYSRQLPQARTEGGAKIYATVENSRDDGDKNTHALQDQPRVELDTSEEGFRKHEKQMQDGTGPATALDDMLKVDCSASEAWAYFIKQFPSRNSPALIKPFLGDLPRMSRNEVFGKLLEKVVREAVTVGVHDGVPPFQQACVKLNSLGVMESSFYLNSILIALTANPRSEASAVPPLASQSSETATTQTHDDAVVRSIVLYSWRCLFKQDFSTRPGKGRKRVTPLSPDWPTIPAGAELHNMIGRNSRSKSKTLEARLNDYFSKGDVKAGDSQLAVALLLTYDKLLNDGIVRDEFAPFMHAASHILLAVDLNSSLLKTSAKLSREGYSEESIRTILHRLSNIPAQAAAFLCTTPNNEELDSPGGSEVGTGEESRTSSLQAYYYNQLAWARERQDYRIVEAAWKDLRTIYAAENGSSFNIPTRLYDNLIMSAMAMRHPTAALEFWNAMVANGATPTVKTWTAMLTGCGHAQEVSTMEEIWQKMLASGVNPDSAAWLTRIYNTLLSGAYQQGTRQLKEMGENWLRYALHSLETDEKRKAQGKALGIAEVFAEIGDFPEAPKPSVAVMNAAIKAFAKGRRKTQIMQTLAWAQPFGIKPDIITFNIMMSLALRNNDNNAAEAMQLMRQMDQANIEPDIATFNILINAAMKQADFAKTPEEQREAVKRILAQAESFSLQANTHVLTTLLDRTLKLYNDVDTANIVLDYMKAKSIEPGSAVSTVIATHYFQQTPPNTAALEALYDDILKNRYVVDGIFYDRMIEGYAALNDTQKVAFFLKKMRAEQKRPGWRAILEAVLALCRTGQRGAAMRLVRDVKMNEGVAQHGLSHSSTLNPLHRKRVWRVEREFWAAVQELGLDEEVDEEDGVGTAGFERGGEVGAGWMAGV